MFKLIKTFLSDDTTYYALLLLVLCVGSFGLGRVSVPVEISTESAASVVLTNEAVSTAETVDVELVASVNGTKYHYLWCPGAKQMSEANKIYFANVTEARAAGYEPAKNCAGLE